MSHTFLYLDESGCLGFKSAHSTQYFVITLLKIEGEDAQRKVIKAIKRTIKNKIPFKKNQMVHELKASRTVLTIKEYFIKQMPPEGWKIYSVILNKKRVAPHLQTTEGKNRLYNYLVKFLMENVKLKTDISRLDLYLDKCKNAKEQKIFNTYINAHINLPIQVPLNISHVISHENHGIQAVDLFCWGIARKYEEKTDEKKKDIKWYLRFKEHINFEEVYLPDKKEKSVTPLVRVPQGFTSR